MLIKIYRGSIVLSFKEALIENNISILSGFLFMRVGKQLVWLGIFINERLKIAI